MFSQFTDFFTTLVGSFEQAHLHDQLIKYLKVAHILDEKRSGQKQPMRDQTLAAILKASKGHCSGWTPLYLYAEWLQEQPRVVDPGTGEFLARDDLEWLKSTLIRLAKWKGDVNKLTVKDGEDFDRVLNHIEFFQNIDNYLSTVSHGEISSYFEDTRGHQIRKEYVLGGLFTLNDLILILPQIIKDNRMLLITSHDHMTGMNIRMYKKNDEIFFYNSNRVMGEKKFHVSDVKSLAQQIFLSNFSVNDKPSPLGFRVYSLGKVKAETYPNQADLIKQTECMRNDKYGVNYVADDADQYTPLITAAGIDDVVSAAYYLQQGADIKMKNNKEKTALDLAMNRNLVQAVKLLIDAERKQSEFFLEQPDMAEVFVTAKHDKISDEIRVALCSEVLNTKTINHAEKFKKILISSISLAAHAKHAEFFLLLTEKAQSLRFLDNHEFNMILKNAMKNFDDDTIFKTLQIIISSDLSPDKLFDLYFLALQNAIMADKKDIYDEITALFKMSKKDFFQALKRENDDQQNLFQLAIISKNNPAILQSMLDLMSNKNSFNKFLHKYDENKNNVLHLAASIAGGHKKILLLAKYFTEDELIEKLKEANMSGGFTPLHLVVNSGEKEEMRAILKLTTIVDYSDNLFVELMLARDKHGQTILHIAVNQARVNMVIEIMNQAQANKTVFNKLIFAEDKYDNNIFHFAFRKQMLNFALIENLVNSFDNTSLQTLLHKKNEDGKTPLEYLQSSLTKNLENKFVYDYFMDEMKKRGLEVENKVIPKNSPQPF